MEETRGNRRHEVYGIGHAVVVLLFKQGPETFESHGVRKGEMAHVNRRSLVSILRKSPERPDYTGFGGSVGNTIIALSLLGVDCVYSSVVGEDEFGVLSRKEIRTSGATPLLRTAPGRPTGVCVVLVSNDGERTLITELGASANFGPKDVHERTIANSRWLLVEGYLLTVPTGKQTAKGAIESAVRCGTRVALTLSSNTAAEIVRQDLTWYSSHCNLFFGNHREAAVLTGCKTNSETMRVLQKLPVTTIVTLSGNGAYVVREGRVQMIPINRAQALDATGAGDAFAAGYLFGELRGMPLHQCATMGHHLASVVISRFGPHIMRNEIDLNGLLCPLMMQ